MRAGTMRYRLKLQKPADSAASEGVVTQSWQTVGTVWCDIIPMGTRESIFALDAMSTEEQLEVRIRKSTYPDLTPACRFTSTDGTKVYQISQVIADDTRNHTWSCSCQRREM